MRLVFRSHPFAYGRVTPHNDTGSRKGPNEEFIL